MLLLVTGGAGFIGRHLVNRLLATTAGTVRVVDNESRGQLPTARREHLESIRADIRDSSELRRAMQGCDTVFHLAAEAAVMGCEHRPFEAHEVNATGTLTVLRLAHELGIGRVVVASSREVYGEVTHLPVGEAVPMKPKNVYGATKAAAEAYCSWLSSFLQIAVLRLSNVYGSGDTDRVIPRFIAEAQADRPLTLFGGQQILDFVWIHHVVEAFVRAGRQSRNVGVLNVASGKGVTILDTARRVIELCASSSTCNVLAARDAEVSRFVADVTRMEQELGIARPTDPLEHLAGLCRSVVGQTSEPAVSRAEAGSDCRD